MSSFLSHLRLAVLKMEKNIHFLLSGQYTPDTFDMIVSETYNLQGNSRAMLPMHELLNDSILWAVPKSRRSIEKRLQRKFGWPEHVWKPLVPKKSLVSCKSCGGHVDIGYLCPTCYSKVKAETEKLKEIIEKEIGLNPNDKEVIIMYKGEKEVISPELYNGRRIIEIEKTRPQWFSNNLLEKTTKGQESTSSVKPSDLA